VWSSGLGLDIVTLKSELMNVFGQQANSLYIGLSLFTQLVGGSAVNDQVDSLYQTIILVICSLAIIWAVRRVQEKPKTPPNLRQAFYSSTYPLIPFLGVLFVMFVQLLPISLASALYLQVIVNGLAVTMREQIVWTLLIAVLSFISYYLISSSVFALYIVSLPNMAPIKSLKAASQLVKRRRLQVAVKFLWLGVILFVVFAGVTVPLILVAPKFAQIVFLVMGLGVLPLAHSYIYNLYRSLL